MDKFGSKEWYNSLTPSAKVITWVVCLTVFVVSIVLFISSLFWAG